MKAIGGNSGYVGYSMSVRAMRARNEGSYPKSDFKKMYGISANAFDILVGAGVVYVSEWHHTSKYGNRTDFYRWDDESLSEVYDERKKDIAKMLRELGRRPKFDGGENDMEAYMEYLKADEEWCLRRRDVVECVKEIFFND